MEFMRPYISYEVDKPLNRKSSRNNVQKMISKANKPKSQTKVINYFFRFYEFNDLIHFFSRIRAKALWSAQL